MIGAAMLLAFSNAQSTMLQSKLHESQTTVRPEADALLAFKTDRNSRGKQRCVFSVTQIIGCQSEIIRIGQMHSVAMPTAI